MKALYGVRILNALSLLFATFNCIASFIRLKELNGFLYVALWVALFVVYLIRKKEFFEASYYSFADRFKKGICLIAVTCFISLLSGQGKVIERSTIAYIIIYLVSSIVLLRTMRHMQYNEESTQLNKMNLRYATLIVCLSIFLSIKTIRTSMLHAILEVYQFIISIITYFLSWIIYGISIVFEYLLDLFKNLFPKVKPSSFTLQVQDNPFFEFVDYNRTDMFARLISNKLFIIFWRVALTLIFLYMILKILGKSSHSNREEKDYIESREFIMIKNENNALKGILSKFRSGGYAEQIRYYYQKFIKLCIDREVDIKESDTTLQINQKSITIFDDEAAREMRKIYLRVRYNNDIVDKSTFNDFYCCYKRLKNNSDVVEYK